MTTKAQAQLYLAQHLAEFEALGYAVHNPKDRPVEELPTIYGFNNGGISGWYNAVLLSEDGHCLGSHMCSHESYMRHDLGILEGTRPDRHETFQEHYPDGYRMEFVEGCDLQSHVGFRRALDENVKLGEEGEPKTDD